MRSIANKARKWKGILKMPKYNFTLYAICMKEYTLEGKDKNDVELQAIEDFKKNVFSEIDENETYGQGFKEV